jgi:Fe-Mn family superoxide dismutase
MNKKTNRRKFIQQMGMATLGTIALSQIKPVSAFANSLEGEVLFTLDALPYEFKALEPHIDALTMEIHHDKHHKAYVDNLNKLCAKEGIQEKSLEVLLSKVGSYSAGVKNNAGGHYNHTLFWKMMKANGGGLPTGAVNDAINSSFGTFDQFKAKFIETAKGRFGSGWAWLVAKDGKLTIGSTANQENPLMDVSELKGTPLLCLDVWEHAYYLKYQNKRADYIDAWFNVINWDTVSDQLKSAK